MTYLLDTNVVSETRRRRPDRAVVAWLAAAAADELHVSVLTMGELHRGVESLRRRDPRTAAGLDAWLSDLTSAYKGRIVSVDAVTADRWGRLNVPDPLPFTDSLIAATALVRGWTVVTRNVVDFDRTGVRVLNPFEPQT